MSNKSQSTGFELQKEFKRGYTISQHNAPVAVSGEPYGWVIDCKPEFIEDLNYEERNFFIEDKNQLSYYIGTEEEPSMYDITPLYLAPPNTPELEQANKVLEGKLDRMQLFIDKAFQAHSNLDLDIQALEGV